jgi:hypothetical protein
VGKPALDRHRPARARVRAQEAGRAKITVSREGANPLVCFGLAVLAFNRAIELNPEHPTTWNNKGYTLDLRRI